MKCPNCDYPSMEVVAESDSAADRLSNSPTALHAVMWHCEKCGYHEWRSK